MAFMNYESPGYSITDLVDELLACDTYTARDRHLTTTAFPRVDIIEEKNHYSMVADLPGLDQKEIKIEVKDGILSISGEKKEEKSDRSSDMYCHLERRYGSFRREFSLPEYIDDEHIEATLTNGVLTLTLNKKETSKTTSIEVKAQ